MPRGKSSRPKRSVDELLRRGTEDHYEDASLYDFEYGDQEEDVEWYVAWAKRERAKTVLELGAGSGRITLPLAAAGVEVVALDRMQSMLDRLVERADSEDLDERIEPVLADMRELPFDDASFRHVISPFNALQHLYTWSDLLTCFREVHRVLEKGGRFVFDVLLPDLEWLLLDPDERHCVTRFTHPETGEKLLYSTNHTYDHHSQVCHIRIHYDRAPNRGTRIPPKQTPLKTVLLAHRQIFPEEIRALLDIAGFELESLSGDFLGLSLSDEIESQVVECCKR